MVRGGEGGRAFRRRRRERKRKKIEKEWEKKILWRENRKREREKNRARECSHSKTVYVKRKIIYIE